MTRTTVPFTLDHLEALDALEVPCRACVFWELDPVRRNRLGDDEARDVKESWMSEVLREWGSCGRVALVDGVAVGYLTYAPPSYVPGAALFPTAPASPDAVLLTTAYVADGYDGAGIGRLLVQGMARDLVGRSGIKAVEAFAYGGNRLARRRLPAARGVPGAGRLQDPSAPPPHAADADGAALAGQLARRGRGGDRAAGRRRTPEEEPDPGPPRARTGRKRDSP